MRRTRLLACALAALLSLATSAAAQKPADDTPERHLANGWAALNKSDYKLARKELGRATKLRKDYAEAYLALAAVARAEGKTDDAMRQVGRALAARPDSAEAHYMRGRLFFDENEIEYARAESDRALALDPKLAAAHVLAGDLEAAAKKFPEAVAHLDEARALAPAAFDDVPRLVERHDALKEYVAFRAHEYSKNPAFKQPSVRNRPMPHYTDQARRNKTAGDLDVLVRFDERGKVDKVVVLTGLPDGLTANAVDAARRLEATPATLDGAPVPAWATVRVNFSIRR